MGLGLSCFFIGFVTLLLANRYGTLAQVATWAPIILILVSIAKWNWPLHFAFQGTQASFDAAARLVLSDKSPETPFWVGPFRIHKAEVYFNGIVCFWTDLDAGGKTGFVQCGPTNPPFNVRSHTKLTDTWQLIAED